MLCCQPFNTFRYTVNPKLRRIGYNFVIRWFSSYLPLGMGQCNTCIKMLSEYVCTAYLITVIASVNITAK